MDSDGPSGSGHQGQGRHGTRLPIRFPTAQAARDRAVSFGSLTTEPNLKAITGKREMLLSYVLACRCLIRSFSANMKKLTSQPEERYKYCRVEQQAFQRPPCVHPETISTPTPSLPVAGVPCLCQPPMRHQKASELLLPWAASGVLAPPPWKRAGLSRLLTGCLVLATRASPQMPLSQGACPDLCYYLHHAITSLL